MQSSVISRAFGVAVLAAIALCGCHRARIIPATTSFADFDVAYPRERVFDAALSVANRLNLNVAVLEKSSGLLRFRAPF